ncbi:bifunctional 2',3'-cyclic-nucleotide 2'-phosphodiesterase/3'-nucleotidase [Paraferrimonas sp. SM1919]|uniref:bifunctional 2',3'-cyclic-nucleotide 2'-phosphodiesterase/3'-nucleotidase n=1 Tax=Paraferrimonas sp. SM1919 TaxID=2662263 RepID=UPI0013D1D3C0|nr:bifunctional 2',3'-cyclic-nucleotide 2'-phosphodiesterase/3'-nucleotidase [Paraferrimonas sp. SM1919]
MKKLINHSLILSLPFFALGCQEAAKPQPVNVELRILETSDLHANMLDFNYYAGKEDPKIGFARTATLIKQQRLAVTNSVLVDNGDLLQGSPMADYIANQYQQGQGVAKGQGNPIYHAMNTLNYDVGNIGNHEFNFGLDFLEKSLASSYFPYINANVYCAQAECWQGIKQGQNLFTPYIIKPTQVKDLTGQIHTLNIGYIGFVPPQIMQWDRNHLEGKVAAEDILLSARKFVPQMKAKGADIIIAIPHSGLGSSQAPAEINAENATFHLASVPGINAILFGHSHSVFPGPSFSGIEGIDLKKGSINGVPAVMPGRWGDNLGVIDLSLQKSEQGWQVLDYQARAVPIFDKKPMVAADPHIHNIMADTHQGTLNFVNQDIGYAKQPLNSYLALVQDSPSMQIVADAQQARVKQLLSQNEQLKHLPVLSAAAPFKSGGRHSTANDADQYTNVAAGELSFKNAADLYLYPNTLVAVKVSGQQLKDWLECSANQFNQIDVNSTMPQQLINWSGHPTFNFDVIEGVDYQIDITQPSRFDRECQLVNENTSRITGLTYTNEQGKSVSGDELLAMEFVVATNNYRAFGGKFAGTGSEQVILEAPDENRTVLSQYISDKTTALGYVPVQADNNWRFKTIESKLKLDIRLQTSASDNATAYIKQSAILPMQYLKQDELGFAEYRINLQ